MVDLVKVKDCCEILDSKRIPITASKREKGIYPYYGANGIQDHINKYLFDDELVLVAEDGGNFNSQTKPIAYRVSGKCWVNNHAHVLKPKSFLDVDYLCYALAFYKVGNLVNGATRKKLTQKALKAMTIPIISLPEQKMIVNKIKLVKELIKIKEQELSKLDTLIKARFVEMFGDLKFDTPVSKYIESLTAGKSLAGKEKCTNKVLNTGAVSYDKFKNDYKYLPSNYVPDENNKVRTGNVLISRMNTQELVGATAYVWEAPENTYLPDRLWRANLKENVNSIFLWQVLIHPLLKLQIQRVSSGTSGSMKNISKSNFLKLKVPDVNEESQNKFASFVQQVDKSKVAIQKSLDETQTLFDSLMQKYFS